MIAYDRNYQQNRLLRLHRLMEKDKLSVYRLGIYTALKKVKDKLDK